MLSGVGGRSIEEAQHRLSYSEVRSWILYRNKYGSLHPGMRIDRAIARAMVLLTRLASKNSRMTEVDFSPFDLAAKKEREAVEGASIEDVFKLLSSMSRSN